MAYTTIDKPSSYFNTVTYSGNGTNPTSITTVGFKPDWVWFKNRSTTNSHSLFDILRGVTKNLITNSTAAESTNTQGLTSFNSDGFTVGNDADVNGSSNNMVAWNWLANGAGVSNTSGSITSTVSANTTSGFSIVSYTGNGNTAASVGHGLGVTPAMMIVKKRSATHEWTIWHKSLSSSTQSYLQFDTLAAQTSANTWGNTAPTSSLFYVGSASVTNGSSATFIAYCFAEIKGYSKFGSYTGNGSTDGTFIYTGFKPSWVLLKDTTTGGNSWEILDNKRNTYNVMGERLYPDLSAAGSTATVIDFLSNGFKLRTSTDTWINTSGNTYIYAAFAENPFVSSKGLPCTAR